MGKYPLFFILVILIISCAPKASEKEIGEMCDRLLVLRNKQGDLEMKKECLLKAREEGTTKRQARCRIKAVNKQEYWIRCRTGK